MQATLALIESLEKQSQLHAKQAEKPAPPPEKKKAAPRQRSGPTEQPLLPVIEQVFLLDDADRSCPSCGGELRPMTGQYETSEMIDVVEVSYRIVKVEQQK